MSEYRYGCTYCGDFREVGGVWGLQRDHIIPRFWPASPLSDDNITMACRKCNRDKGTADPSTWFFILVQRDGAVLGRGETLADVRADRLWTYWADDIRRLHGVVGEMLPVGVAS